MGATARIPIAGVLVAIGVLGLGPFLPGPAQGRSQAQNPSCQFTLAIPKLGLFPLIRRLRGDDDIDGNAADVRIEAHLFQPKWRQGEEPQGLKLDLDLQISEVKGDGSAYQGSKSFWVKDKWIVGGDTRQVQTCLQGIFKKCVEIFAKEARTEAQLMAQCAFASQWRIKETMKVRSPTRNRKWTKYKNKKAKLMKSIECLSDANGPDAGKVGCKTITFLPKLRINVNFSQNPLVR